MQQLQAKDSSMQLQASLWPLVVSLILIASTMRAPLTSIGSLISEISTSLELSNTTAGLVTSMPLLAFAILSPFAPGLAQRFGIAKVLATAAVVLTIGISIRSIGSITALFTGTILLGLAIAVCNVLLPSFVKTVFPHKLGLMTGIYSVSMNLCGAIASGVSVPLASQAGLGWRGALAVWAILASVALVCWLLQIRNPRLQSQPTYANRKVQQSGTLLRSSLAWSITLFMGLQSMFFYIIVAWMPNILQDRGMSAEDAGWMLSLLQFALLPLTFIVPIWAGRRVSQQPLVWIMFLLLFTGIIGLMHGSNGLIPLFVILLGIGGGFAFSLAMMFFTLRTRDANEAAKLSGMAQSAGYLLAAAGPIIFGLIHDLSHSWTIPLYMIVFTVVLLLLFGSHASKNKYVT